MAYSTTENTTTSTKKKLIITAIVVLIVLVLGFGAWWLFVRDGRQDLTLETFKGFDGEVFDGLVESDCSAEDGCIEALANEQVEFYRFDDKGAAEQFATATPGALQSDWIVMVMSDDSLTQRERDAAFELVDSTWRAE